MAMSTFFPDLLFAFRRRTRRATGRQRSRNSRAGAAAALGAALVLFCPGVALAAPGDLDPTFGTGGKVTTDFGSGSDFADAVQADGKIIAAGGSDSSGSRDFALARYNTDGSLDTTFDTDGKVTTDFGSGSDDVALGVAVQADGKIVAAGLSNSGGSYDFALARYNTDGSLDTTFDTDGKVTTDFGGSGDEAHGVALQTDGRIVAVGQSGSGGVEDFALARYNTDGSLDTTFDTDGKVTTDFGSGTDDEARGVALQTDGKIVAAGLSNSAGDYDFALARYNTNGSLDTTFDTDGKVTTDFGTSDDQAYGVALQTDGKIVAAGQSDPGGISDFALARYNTNGSLDTTFDTDGKVTTNFAGSDDGAFGVALQTDGKIVAAGQSGSGGIDDFALARYNTDGSLDTTFDTDGKVTTDFGSGSDDAAFGVALQTDGKIVAAGFSDSSGNSDFALARYQDGGSAPVGVDVSVTKTGPTTVKLGHHISYTVTVTNTSTTNSATALTMDDTLTGPGRLRSATPSQGTCTTTSTSATCTLGTLTPGASATVTVVVKPTATGTISDTATADAAEPDPVPDNNTANATTTVNQKGCPPCKPKEHQKPGKHKWCERPGKHKGCEKPGKPQAQG
ncbi:calcium-binding protein [Streptomyces sp. NPDC000880]